MPSTASAQPSDYLRHCPPYFKSLAELDDWVGRPSSHQRRLSGVIDYTQRRHVDGVPSEGKGKLLVCHDYKGGYTESPVALSYTFNFWQYCDTFIYFSHHRVTVPPPGWINAAHRQGVKMLGVLIFEGAEGAYDCLQLLVGKLPHSRTGAAASSPNISSLPLSPHYARILADLAHQRGFDGYLLNVEVPLQGGTEQTRLLASWISLLQHELNRKVGPHAEVVWYDSVVYTGQLRWQDRLNSYNLPFFLPSSAFFTNYTWPPHFPSLTAQYFLNLDSAIMPKPKALQDIHIGVDVWGRGSHGGGGFGCYQAISHIDPEFLGLSVALFGQAWTWESEQDKPGWSWEAWWAYERLLWVGPQNADDVLPLPPPRQTPLRDGETECPHGPFRPLSSFFIRRPPPNPADYPLFTTFCPGVGRAWFAGGKKVADFKDGWTDVDKTGTLGDLVWPRPTIHWETDQRTEELPSASTSLYMDDAWLGGNSLSLSVNFHGSDAEDAFFRCIWLPVQSVATTPGKSYDITVVYKIVPNDGIDVDVGASAKKLAESVPEEVQVEPAAENATEELAHGWHKLAVQIKLPADHNTDVLIAVGLVIGVAAEDPTADIDVSLLLGSLSVFPSLPSSRHSSFEPRVLWADFDRAVDEQGTSGEATKAEGTVIWGTAASFTSTAPVTITGPEETEPVWSLDPFFPTFAYFNVYIQPFSRDGNVPSLDEALFVGTSGMDGRGDLLYVGGMSSPKIPDETETIRYVVQGITNRGEILSWEHCAFTSVTLR